jgi:uncharacterized alpha/beta hydrolase family protein
MMEDVIDNCIMKLDTEEEAVYLDREDSVSVLYGIIIIIIIIIIIRMIIMIIIIREQHSRKPRSQRTTENSHIGHCTYTSESANIKAQKNQCRN